MFTNISIVWINKGFITPQKSKYLTNVEIFNTDAVLEGLRKYQTAHSEERIQKKYYKKLIT
jgi:hypothetical protein